MKIMVYFQLFIDFGFLLSATEEVSKNRQDTQRLNVIMTAVTCCKLALSVLSLGVLIVLLTINWKLALITCAPIPLILLSGVIFSKKVRPYFRLS